MSTLAKLLVLFTLALSVNSLATPHVVRSPHSHRALAARMAVAEPVPAVEPYGVKVAKPKRKRGDSRCRARFSSAVSSSTSSSQSQAPTTPVANVAPAPTHESDPAPAPSSSENVSSSKAPAPSSSENASSSKAPAPQSTQNSGGNSGSSSSSNSGLSFLSGTQTGQATFYQIGLGACGVTNSGNDKIAAVSHLLFDAFPGYSGVNPNSNPVCGKSITLTYQGKSTTVKIEDRCEACALTDIDLAPSAFEELADFSVGRLSGMSWVWND